MHYNILLITDLNSIKIIYFFTYISGPAHAGQCDTVQQQKRSKFNNNIFTRYNLFVTVNNWKFSGSATSSFLQNEDANLCWHFYREIHLKWYTDITNKISESKHGNKALLLYNKQVIAF